ncbi:MAG TPA: histidine kinase dimerization/phosphoacceptor domain -containing protein [Bryobacteraceae bacterium]|nr:histidine kinase dimerization/phosphoacceptor domain -containing protein [Bryobacteraceae bacterium]
MPTPADNVLFSPDLWAGALESYARAAHLTIKVFDAEERTVLGPVHPTPLFQLFEERIGSDPGLFAQCARRCLTQMNGHRAEIVSRYGLSVVGIPLVLDGRIVGAAVGGYAFVDFVHISEVQHWAKESRFGFDRIWQVAREQKPVPQHRLILNGELLQVLGDALLRENSRTRQYEQGLRTLEQTSTALRDSEEKFRLFVENVQEYALVQSDPAGNIVSWNPGAQRLFGFTTEDILGKNFSALLMPDDDAAGVSQEELTSVANGHYKEVARWLVRQDGSPFWARWITEPIRDERGTFRGTARIIRDETERAQAEASIRGSLAEKEELLKEVHHRVKNNLQVITSLLNMQARQIENREVLSHFEEARNRVFSIAAIHELLCRSVSFSCIDLAAYARQLAPDLVRFYNAQDRIGLSVIGDGVTLELERAVPYGLLLNELISNACKHAFPGTQRGNIMVSFGREDGDIELTVSDDGQGLPPDFDYDRASSLGLKLVRSLARQLRGSAEMESSGGTTVRVRFPETGGTDDA